MKVGPAVVVLDGNEWLPGHGENSVSINMDDRHNLSVIVSCDSEESGEEVTRVLHFKGVCEFNFAAMPGPVFDAPVPDAGEVPDPIYPAGSLVQYPHSKHAQAWTRHFENLRLFRHYNILFLSDNSRLTVFAEAFEFRDAPATGIGSSL